MYVALVTAVLPLAAAAGDDSDPDATVLIPLVPAEVDQPTDNPSPDEPRQTGSTPTEIDPVRLLAKLQRTDPGTKEYRRLAETLLSAGTEQAPRLLATISRDADRLRQRYLKQVRHRAEQALKQRWDRRTLAEAQRLRSVILTNACKTGLTKEQIVATSDPARERLNRLYLDDAKPLLEHSDELRQRRRTLLDLADLSHRAWQQVEARRRKAIDAPSDRKQAEEQLFADEELALLLASPMPSGDRAVILHNRKLADKLLPVEARGVLLLNRLRTRLGLRALKIDLRMQAAARGHSRDMAEHGFFSHTSPLPGKTEFEDRGRRAGTTIHGENIHQGSDDAAEALQGWWHSPGHHKNLLHESFRRVGVGYHALYWTQNFGR